MSALKNPSDEQARAAGSSAVPAAPGGADDVLARTLFMGGPTIVFKWRATEGWPVEYVSPNIRQFGYAAEDFTSGKVPYADIVHPDDIERIAAEVSQSHRGGRGLLRAGIPLEDPRGRDPLGFRLHHGGAGCAAPRDALSRLRTRHHATGKQAEEALRESRGHYEAMVESFDGLIYICSSDYKVEFMNQRFIERTGYNAVGHLCYKALHDLEEVCPWCVNENVLRGRPSAGRCRAPRTTDGTTWSTPPSGTPTARSPRWR